jgi:hypothetical protein
MLTSFNVFEEKNLDNPFEDCFLQLEFTVEKSIPGYGGR